MSIAPLQRRWWTPIKVGIALTLLILGLFVVMAMLERCGLDNKQIRLCRHNFAWFLDSPPNEIGDTLAGFAGSLAFVWIVVTAWIQSIELREQRTELGAQRQEFEKMVAAQNSQVEALRLQATALTDEMRRRDDAAIVSFIDERLLTLGDYLTWDYLLDLNWRIAVSGTGSAESFQTISTFDSYKGPGHKRDAVTMLKFIAPALTTTRSRLLEMIGAGYRIYKSPEIDPLLQSLAILEELKPFFARLPSASIEKYSRARLMDASHEINEIVSDNNFWMGRAQ